MFDKYILSPILNSLATFSDYNSFFINGKYYTYRYLATIISKVRTEIQLSSFSGKTIGLVTNDDIETYASIIAVWLEGYTYIPIHPHYPVDRGMEIIKQGQINLIIDSSEPSVYTSTCIIRSRRLSFRGWNLNLNQLDDSTIAYILFTSGSTGKPKGVPITRGNLGAFMQAFWEVGFKINENDRCLQCFDLTFDVSVQSFLVPLTKGACTYTIPHDQIKYSYASELLEDHRLTFCVMAPSMVRFFKPYFDEISLPFLRYSVLTAEASPLNLVKEWSVCIPNAEIFDFYGPTEATIYCTYSKLSRNSINKELNGMWSIGKPLMGITAIITDDKGRVQPPNQKGELCISGDQVTSGYWNSPEKNKESFFEISMDGTNKRFYKTGDLCFIDDDGDIMYSGRLDYQVKIQGHRIELGEIEHHSRSYLKGKNSVALVFESNSGNNEIALFVEDASSDKNMLLVALQKKLPSYMIPKRIFFLKEFPINANGKVDRNELKKQITL